MTEPKQMQEPKLKVFKLFTTTGNHLVSATTPDMARKLFKPKQPIGCRIKKIKLVKEDS